MMVESIGSHFGQENCEGRSTRVPKLHHLDDQNLNSVVEPKAKTFIIAL